MEIGSNRTVLRPDPVLTRDFSERIYQELRKNTDTDPHSQADLFGGRGMAMQKSSMNLALVGTFIAAVTMYLVMAFIAFTKSSVIRETQATPTWRWIAEVLAFPAVYLSQWIEAADALVEFAGAARGAPQAGVDP